MKAIYKKPEIQICQLQMQPMMAGSLNNDATQGNTGGATGGNAGGAAGNSSFSLWDNDFDEE